MGRDQKRLDHEDPVPMAEYGDYSKKNEKPGRVQTRGSFTFEKKNSHRFYEKGGLVRAKVVAGRVSP